ncbi:MAG: recombinase family protein [Cyclobacteriaceae bacterium]|nr:recombinase family protein [Cyclobacteriaceae bacterium]
MAKKRQGLIPVPESSVVFMGKLSRGLIKGIKAAAPSMRLSISTVVKIALEEFLSKRERGEKERQPKLACTYDRLCEQKLAQVYRLLVSDLGCNNCLNIYNSPKENMDYENSSDLYQSIFRTAKKESKTIESQVGALVNFAKEKGYFLSEEYIFRDEGYSGAVLVRPGLERIRDLSAEGQIQAVLVYSPDSVKPELRLSGSIDGRTAVQRNRSFICQFPKGRNTRGSFAAPVSRDDSRI